MTKKVILHGIIKHGPEGIGWKITFTNPDDAKHYKEMLMFILKNDGFDAKEQKGYYDSNGVE